MAQEIWILDGPNLNMIGTREPEIYGTVTMPDYVDLLKERYPGLDIRYFQSNIEGEIIDQIHRIGNTARAVLINAGAYTHTSIAIADAIAAVSAPFVEIHLTNVAKRESYRHNSYLTPRCAGLIAGFGMESYRLGMEWILINDA